MPNEHDSAPATRTADVHAAQDFTQAPVSTESGALPAHGAGLALLGRPGDAGRGNGPVRQTALLAAQRAAGNRATRRFVQRAVTAPPAPIVQRAGSGLAAPKVTGAFTAEAQAILDTWDDLKPRDRAWRLADAASAQLEALGAPRIAGDFGDTRQMGANSYGAFSPALWQITLNEAGFRDDCTAEQKARTVGTVYHEARHAEQYFRVARMLAGQAQPGANAASEGARIAKELGLREDVAAVAARSPLSDPAKKKSRSKQEQQERETEYAEAKTWKDAMDRYHGKGGVAETLKTAQARFYAARRGLAETPNDEALKKEYREAYAATRGAYLIYQKQASVESDAWAVGGAVEAALGQTPNTAEEELAKMGADPRTEINIVAGPDATLPRPGANLGVGGGVTGPRAPRNRNFALPQGGLDPNAIAAQGPDQPGAEGPNLATPLVPTGTPPLTGAQGPLDPGIPRVPHKRIFALPKGGLDPNAVTAQGPDPTTGPDANLPGGDPDPGLVVSNTTAPRGRALAWPPRPRASALPQGELEPSAVPTEDPGETGATADPGLPTVGGPAPVDPGIPRVPHKRIFALPQGGLDPRAIAAQGPDQPGAQDPALALPPVPMVAGPLPGAQGPQGAGGPRPLRNRIFPLPTGGLDPNAGVGDAPVQRHALPEELARVTQKEGLDPGAAGDT
jgi:hypothetical protein